MFLRFEDLASRPEETAQAICAFIGEDYVPAMLTMEGASDYRNSGGNSSFNQIQPGTISIRPIGRYRSILTPFELKFIQQFSGALLSRFQYVPDPVPLTVAENAAFIIRFAPYHLLRLAGWWAIHTAQMVRKPPAPANRFQESEETRKGNQVKSHV